MNQPEPTSFGQPAASTPASGYEFDANQSQTISNLATTMSHVAILLMVIGGVQVLGSLFRLNLIGIAQGVIQIVIGVLTKSASDHFQNVAGTAGADIRHLMDALGQLQQVYSVQRIVLIIGIVLVVLALFFLVAFGGLAVLSGVRAR